jgi:ADP-heptose:LPS heptosyltransferase
MLPTEARQAVALNPPGRRAAVGSALLVHLASGIGNIVLATPLLITLSRHGFLVDVLVDADYPETADLLLGWSVLREVFNGAANQYPRGPYAAWIAAIPPFYWSRYRARYSNVPNLLPRPPDVLFYRNEQTYYLQFAKCLGCQIEPAPYYGLPISPGRDAAVDQATVVVAPGCKSGQMAAKRWSHFPELCDEFDDVVVVGTRDDLSEFNGRSLQFPSHVRSFVGSISLRQTAEIMASAGVVVANDSGLGHVAGALGTPTLLLFGPTPDRTLGPLPPNVKVLRAGLVCEPCWFTDRLGACSGGVSCLGSITVGQVAEQVRSLRGLQSPMPDGYWERSARRHPAPLPTSKQDAVGGIPVLSSLT